LVCFSGCVFSPFFFSLVFGSRRCRSKGFGWGGEEGVGTGVLFFICLFILFSYPSVSLFWLSIMPPTNV
jgi:hypothetical protein